MQKLAFSPLFHTRPEASLAIQVDLAITGNSEQEHWAQLHELLHRALKGHLSICVDLPPPSSSMNACMMYNHHFSVAKCQFLTYKKQHFYFRIMGYNNKASIIYLVNWELETLGHLVNGFK